ncbi:MAG: leucine-rich repeat protein, partial [Thermoguttaceae bacterium]|nr:leucine-rich repeat protein [Thermoguttaceae bacterium]
MRRFWILLFFILINFYVHATEARNLALLVGVDEYANIRSLNCCVNDMNLLKKALMKIGFEEDDIYILTTGSSSLFSLPLKRNIEQKTAEILSKAGSSDIVFFAFSGHGVRDGNADYFCPPYADPNDIRGTCVSITKVMEDMSHCKAKFKWMVVDACRNVPTSRDAKGFDVIPTPPSGIVLFQSCAKGERSYEERGTAGNGYFTKNFAAALSGAADMDQDGKLTLFEVCKWTTTKTKEQVMSAENKKQTPYLNGEISDFILTEDLNVLKATKLVEEARKAMDDDDYKRAIEKFDEAIALFPTNESWKRERNSARKLLEKENALQEAASSPLQPTSRDSFKWRGTNITGYIGKETRVVIPEGTTEIDYGAFIFSKFITSVTIPRGVTMIRSSAFDGCSSLTSIVIPEGVTRIGHCAFRGCSSLMSVVIPDSVEKIEYGAFSDCPKLKKLIISSDHPCFKLIGTGLLTKDGKRLIACLGSAKECRIPESVTEIEKYAFSGCSSLTSIAIPKGVTEIGTDSFSDCSSLTSVAIPESVKEIGDRAFSGCSSLTSIAIPENVTKIGESAFSGCSSLTSIA